jgi:riboflavin biosynthesis pyrimidine reductase
MAAMSDSELTLVGMRHLDDEALAAAYAPRAEPWMRVNFVSTADGAAQGDDGLSKGINNAADKRVFNLLRTMADCLVVGAGTLRAEEYKVPRLPLVVVSRSGRVPASLVGAPPGRVTMATIATAPHLSETRALLGPEQVLVLGEDEVDLVALKAELTARGWLDQLCEGGPHLFGSLVAAGVVDELCHTVVPRLIGGQHLRILAGVHVDVELEPVTLLEQDGTILGRWLVSR